MDEGRLGEGAMRFPVDPRWIETGAERGQSWLRHQEGERHPVSGVTAGYQPAGWREGQSQTQRSLP